MLTPSTTNTPTTQVGIKPGSAGGETLPPGVGFVARSRVEKGDELFISYGAHTMDVFLGGCHLSVILDSAIINVLLLF